MRPLAKSYCAVVTAMIGLALLAAACSDVRSPTAQDLASSVARVSGSACSRTVEGSAVLIADDLYLTSAHVIAGAESDLQVRTPDGLDIAATVVGFDPYRDLALMKVEGAPGFPLPIGSAQEGDHGVIASVTRNLDIELIPYEVIRRITATGGDTYAEGEFERQAVEVAANVKPGVSGAALVNPDNEVVGVVFAESRTRESTYAVDASEIEAFIREVDITGEIAPGWCR